MTQCLSGQQHSLPDTAIDGKNPAPVDMTNIPSFAGFYTSRVVQDFFHQQYEWQIHQKNHVVHTLEQVSAPKDLYTQSIQVCPKKGITHIILF